MGIQGFGTDLDNSVEGPDGLPGLSPMLEVVTGNTLLAQALMHRLETPRGGLLDDPNYGYDLRALANESITTTKLFGTQRAIATELAKDERVTSVQVSLSFDPATSALTIKVAALTAEGPFRLTLEATSLSVRILSLT